MGGEGKKMSPKAKPDRESPTEPVRWVSRAPGGAGTEDRLAALIRAAEPARELGGVSRARVWSRLRRTSRSRRPLFGLRWGIAVAVLLTSGVVIGAMSARRWWPERSAGTPAPVKHPSAHAARHRSERPGELAPLPEAIPAEDAPAIPAPAPDRVEAQAESPIPERAPEASPAPRIAAPSRAHRSGTSRGARPRELASATAAREGATGASDLAGETPLLSEALTQLRQKRDAQGALATLDVYRARYPEGTLKHEAESARIDALLLLGRDDDALAELRRMPLQAQGRDLELRLIRGELAAATDCARAIADFDRVLAERSRDAFAERALHGRAACRARAGDPAGAKHDLAEYLRRYPSGRFAAEARRRMGDGADDNL
jgi:hypothetical protein